MVTDDDDDRLYGVEVIFRWGAGMRMVEFTGRPNSIRLLPDEARELAAALLAKADDAEEVA